MNKPSGAAGAAAPVNRLSAGNSISSYSGGAASVGSVGVLVTSIGKSTCSSANNASMAKGASDGDLPSISSTSLSTIRTLSPGSATPISTFSASSSLPLASSQHSLSNSSGENLAISGSGNFLSAGASTSAPPPYSLSSQSSYASSSPSASSFSSYCSPNSASNHPLSSLSSIMPLSNSAGGHHNHNYKATVNSNLVVNTMTHHHNSYEHNSTSAPPPFLSSGGSSEISSVADGSAFNNCLATSSASSSLSYHPYDHLSNSFNHHQHNNNTSPNYTTYSNSSNYGSHYSNQSNYIKSQSSSRGEYASVGGASIGNSGGGTSSSNSEMRVGGGGKAVNENLCFYDSGKSKVGIADLEKLASFYNHMEPSQRHFYILCFCILCFFLMLSSYFLFTWCLFILFSSILMSFTGIMFSLWLFAWISRFDMGSSSMREVSEAIREGSEGFFAVQYGYIMKITFFFAFLLFLLYSFRSSSTNDSSALSPSPVHSKHYGADTSRSGRYGDRNQNDSDINGIYLSPFSTALVTALSFVMGAFCSALTGYSGMWVSVRANVRVASAARRCYNAALQICFRGGAFSSLINVSLAVGGISLLLLLLRLFLPHSPLHELPLLVVGYGFGASSVAMFAQLGGGIYTKAADVGADLVGKVEAGIPEDDQRNPAVIADLVGDNVGDCAGQCADLFESIAAEITAAMILGGALAAESAGRMTEEETAGFVLFPLAVHCMDLLVSSIGIMFVRTKKGLPDADSASGGSDDPMRIMIKAYLFTCFLGFVGFCILCRVFLHTAENPAGWIYFSACGGVGMICAFLFVIVTQYYTDYEYAQVRRISEASVTGPATNVIAGLSVGMESTALPVLLICFGLISSYYLGIASGIGNGHEKGMVGLFGTAVSTMGMLCTAVFVLSMSSFGPIADNAGGIVEMSQQPEHVRAITDRLDAVGNVTKANTKGFSVGSASLACFLLFSAFLDEVKVYSTAPVAVVDLTKPEVFVGGLLGSMLVFLFASWSIEAVGRTAQEVVKEVRRQFREHPGIMTYQDKPDYHSCVAIVSRAALSQMLKPGLLAILSPVAVGAIFRLIGHLRNDPLLTPEVIASFLMSSTATGILMALFLNNAGGAWDNAKKYIETGAFEGKNSEAHKAAVVGDTVGDPCKDTAGPSIHVLMKLVSTVTMVLTPVMVGRTT